MNIECDHKKNFFRRLKLRDAIKIINLVDDFRASEWLMNELKLLHDCSSLHSIYIHTYMRDERKCFLTLCICTLGHRHSIKNYSLFLNILLSYCAFFSMQFQTCFFFRCNSSSIINDPYCGLKM